MEHCLIGTGNLLGFERSIDPKGMDRDLIFIFEPDIPAGSEENVQRSEPDGHTTSNAQPPIAT
jgi:hypothetical protein